MVTAIDSNTAITESDASEKNEPSVSLLANDHLQIVFHQSQCAVDDCTSNSCDQDVVQDANVVDSIAELAKSQTTRPCLTSTCVQCDHGPRITPA